MNPVKLQDIIDEMEMQMDEYHKYLNTETGDIITASSEELGIAEESEEDDDFSGYPDWQIEDSWYKFRDEALKKLAVEWC